MNPILDVKDLKHGFDGMEVLFGVNLAVAGGERHAVLGPNGAGKTTLFNLITGLYTPDSGQVFLDGREVTRRPIHRRVRAGMVRSFQITNIFPKLSARESLRAAVLSRRGVRLNPLRPVGAMGEVNAEVDELIERIGLAGQAGVPSGALAYGQQRALEIGLTLALHPRVILLDEPTAGMSSEETRQMVGLIRRVTEGITLVIIEHDMDVVFKLADRITVLNYGQVLASGPQDQVRGDPRVREAYLGEEV